MPRSSEFERRLLWQKKTVLIFVARSFTRVTNLTETTFRKVPIGAAFVFGDFNSSSLYSTKMWVRKRKHKGVNARRVDGKTACMPMDKKVFVQLDESVSS